MLDWRRQVHAIYSTVRQESDPATAHAQWVEQRDHLLKTHPASPVPAEFRTAFPGAAVAPYDETFRFVVPVLYAESQIRGVSTGTDGIVRFERVGTVELPAIGSLDVWWLIGYAGGYFLPIRDADTESYGGGRYLLDTVKGADLGGDGNALVVDLNFSYQPSCAYDPAWACPLAGTGNTVTCAVPVGEKYREVS